MKKLFLSLALLGLTVGCKSQTTDVTDTSVPAADCAVSCDSEMKAECSDMKKAECSDMKKAECSEQKTCPVTGKVMN